MSTPSDITAGLSAPVLPPDADRLSITAVINGQRRVAETVQPITIIGSRRDCDLSLPHPSVGKLHAVIVHLGDRLVLCDLRGRQDTRVNGAAIDRITLAPGMQVQFGDVSIEFEFPRTTRLKYDAAPPCHIELFEGDQSLPIEQAVTVIGRWAASNIVLDTSDVSLSHAVIFPFFGRPVVADLSSRSGVYVNNEHTPAAWLKHDDTIQVGDHTLQVSIEKISLAEFRARCMPGEDGSQAPQIAPPGSIIPDKLKSDQTLATLATSLSELRSQFVQAQTSLSQQAAGIREHAAKLAARENELDNRLKAVASREQNLSQREQRGAQAAEQMAQFRNALQEAKSVFNSAMQTGADEKLPAPMVTGEIFNAAAAIEAAKGKLPPGLRDDEDRPMKIAN